MTMQEDDPSTYVEAVIGYPRNINKIKLTSVATLNCLFSMLKKPSFIGRRCLLGLS
jgi:hypothetical protein